MAGRRAGFTLVEVLLASFLAVIVGGVIFTGYFYAARAVSASKTRVARAERTAVFLFRVMEELSGVEAAEHALAGTAGQIGFVTSAGTERGLVRIAYRVENGQDAPGAVIYRRESMAWEVPAEDEGAGAGAPVFEASTMVFSYYDGMEWHEEWPFPEIPLLVSIKLSTAWGDYEVWARPRTGTDPGPGHGPDAFPDGR